MTRIRHLRHRELDGAERGPGARKRLRHVDDFLDNRAANAADGGIGDTAATSEFTATPASDEISSTAHGLSTGDGPIVLATGDTLPAGLSADQFYWVNVIDADTFTLHTNRLDAGLGQNAVDVTSTGTGTHTWALAADREAIIEYMRQGVWSTELQNLDDVDDVLTLF